MGRLLFLDRELSNGLAQADELLAECILLGVGLPANEPQHLFRVRFYRRAARRSCLFSQLDDSPSGGCRIEAAVLYAVESCREGFECLSVQVAQLGSYPVRDPYLDLSNGASRRGWVNENVKALDASVLNMGDICTCDSCGATGRTGPPKESCDAIMAHSMSGRAQDEIGRQSDE